MKIPELRTIVKTLEKEHLEHLVVELYKLIPNDKKEDYKIDGWIENPPEKGKAKPVKAKTVRSIKDIADDIEFFSSNAYAQNYLVSNHIISKKDRPKWRFVVKRLYNEIQSALDAGNHPPTCSAELLKLYSVLTYSCHWQIFSAYDAFESAGIAQSDFFSKIVSLYRNHDDPPEFIHKSIRLIIDHSLNRYTLYSELIDIFVAQCNTNDLLELCFQQVEKILKDVKAEPEKSKVRFSMTGNKHEMSFEKMEKINNLTEIGFNVKMQLFESDEAIRYFNDNHLETSPEVKLYILLELLHKHNQKDHIVKIIENSLHLKPRKSILDLLAYIKANDKLPQYFS